MPNAVNHVKTNSEGIDMPEKHSPFGCIQADRISQVLIELDDVKALCITLADGQSRLVAGQERLETKIQRIIDREHDEEVVERTLSELDQERDRKAVAKRERLKTTADMVRTVLALGAFLGADRLIAYIAAHWH